MPETQYDPDLFLVQNGRPVLRSYWRVAVFACILIVISMVAPRQILYSVVISDSVQVTDEGLAFRSGTNKSHGHHAMNHSQLPLNTDCPIVVHHPIERQQTWRFTAASVRIDPASNIPSIADLITGQEWDLFPDLGVRHADSVTRSIDNGKTVFF